MSNTFIPGLTPTSYKILSALFDTDSDYSYLHYASLERKTGLMRDDIKPVIDVFRKIELVTYAKGLQTEDGEMYGSGFSIVDDMLKDCEKYMNHNAKVYREYVKSLSTY